MQRLGLFGLLLIAVAGISASAQTAGQEKSQEKTSDSVNADGQVFRFEFDQSYLGVFLEEVTPERMKDLGLSQERGAIVMRVVKDSPAEKAGLKENDTIVSFNGHEVDSVRELQRMLSETPAGRSVSIDLIRSGKPLFLNVTLAKGDWRHQQGLMANGNGLIVPDMKNFVMPKVEIPKFDFYPPNFDDSAFSIGRPRIGISVQPLTDQLASFFGAKDGAGVLVSEVSDGTPAALAGLKAGDVILAVDGTRVNSVGELRAQLGTKQDGQVSFRVLRSHKEVTVSVKIEKRTEGRGRIERILAPSGTYFSHITTI